MPLKFNFNGQIEVEPHPDSPGMYRVIKGCEFFDESQVVRLEYLKTHFTPASGAALDLVDPGRTNRLCPPIIG